MRRPHRELVSAPRRSMWVRSPALTLSGFDDFSLPAWPRKTSNRTGGWPRLSDHFGWPILAGLVLARVEHLIF
jgi:hypothetical protein